MNYKGFTLLKRYVNYKGGVNNLETIEIIKNGSSYKTFTSTKGLALKNANHYIRSII